jgi:hypothetical protein
MLDTLSEEMLLYLAGCAARQRIQDRYLVRPVRAREARLAALANGRFKGGSVH